MNKKKLSFVIILSIFAVVIITIAILLATGVLSGLTVYPPIRVK